MTPGEVLTAVRARLYEYFSELGAGQPDSASVTFLGSEPYELLRYGPDAAGVSHVVSLGASRYPMTDAADAVLDERGPRAEIVISLRGSVFPGLARSAAVLAAAPAVEGLVLAPDALVDLGEPLWDNPSGPAFTAVLLGDSVIGDVSLPEPMAAVRILAATPITANEAAWVRLKGAAALREAWSQAAIDVLDPGRSHAQPS